MLFLKALGFVFILLLGYRATAQYTINSFAGNGQIGSRGDGSSALDALLNYPRSIWQDSLGVIYVTEFNGLVIRKIDSSGIIFRFAGTGDSAVGSDIGPATSIAFNRPMGICGNPSGSTICISDFYANKIRCITTSTTYTIVRAGTGAASSSGDGGPAQSATVSGPVGVVFDNSGQNMFIVEVTTHRVRKVDVNSIITTFAGNGMGTSSGDGGALTSAGFINPYMMHGDTLGRFFLSEGGRRIRSIGTDNIIQNFAGVNGDTSALIASGPATSTALGNPLGVFVDGNNVFITIQEQRIKAVSLAANIISHIAGDGSIATSPTDSNGDGGNARYASLNCPDGIWADTANTVYFADSYNYKIRVLTAPPPTFAPTRSPTYCPTSQPSGQPSRQPTGQPTRQPSSQPSSQPSLQPTSKPSGPTSYPSGQPSMQPSRQPSSQPTLQPVSGPSSLPSSQPSAQPSAQPNAPPSSRPSMQPSSQPSRKPSTQPSSHPSRQPSAQPTTQPTHQPLSRPSSRPSVQPTAQPSKQPSLQPSSQPSTQPSSQPSTQPSVQPSSQPSRQPISAPTSQPTGGPSNKPTTQPSRQPSSCPSSQPSSLPSMQPSSEPSSQPTWQPSCQPSSQPSGLPSNQPTDYPSSQPSGLPSSLPTLQPTQQPSSQPSTWPTTQPTTCPSMQPSSSPTVQPNFNPSGQPSMAPTSEPSTQPSTLPSGQPSTQPSGQPSVAPSSQPSSLPSSQPSQRPSTQPSTAPTSSPSTDPSRQPTSQPSSAPSSVPSQQPVSVPTTQPSCSPSSQPSSQPQATPSTYPTSQPSSHPSAQPSAQPTMCPSGQPSTTPSTHPSSVPSLQPSMQPSTQPSTQPSAQPTSQPSFAPALGIFRNSTWSSNAAASGTSVVGSKMSFRVVLSFLLGSVRGSTAGRAELLNQTLANVTVLPAMVGANYVTFANNRSLVGGSVVDAAHVGIVLSPAVSYDYSGRSVSNAGDINGDGYDDLIIGVPYAARCYVLFGTPQGFVNMRSGVMVESLDSSDFTGWAVSGAGDVNGDGLNDIIIGAPLAHHGAGAAYVLFMPRMRSDRSFSVLLSELRSDQGVVIRGRDLGGHLGVSVSSAGDVNGDGLADIVVGARMTTDFYSGAAHVVYGRSAANQSVSVFVHNMTALMQGYSVYGTAWSNCGHSVGWAGDVNGDGFDDVLIGCVPKRGLAFQPEYSYVLFGGNLTTSRTAGNTDVYLSSTQSHGSSVAKVLNGGSFVGVLGVSCSGYPSTALVFGSKYFSSTNAGSDAATGVAVSTHITCGYSGGGDDDDDDDTAGGLSALPTTEPTLIPIVFNVSLPSLDPTITPTGPTVLPSAAPSRRSRTPSLVPSTAPTTSPTLTTQPSSNSSAVDQSVEPSTKPSKVPTFAPSQSRLRPTFSPTTVVPTVTMLPTRAPSKPDFENINRTVVVVPESGLYNRSASDLHFLINSSAALEVVVTGMGGKDKFSVQPRAMASLMILHFNPAGDVINLSAFPTLRKVSDLNITAGSVLIITLPLGQSIRIRNIGLHNLTMLNFQFQQESAAGESGQRSVLSILIDSSWSVYVLITAIVVVAIVLMCLYWRRVVRRKVHDSLGRWKPDFDIENARLTYLSEVNGIALELEEVFFGDKAKLDNLLRQEQEQKDREEREILRRETQRQRRRELRSGCNNSSYSSNNNSDHSSSSSSSGDSFQISAYNPGTDSDIWRFDYPSAQNSSGLTDPNKTSNRTISSGGDSYRLLRGSKSSSKNNSGLTDYSNLPSFFSISSASAVEQKSDFDELSHYSDIDSWANRSVANGGQPDESKSSSDGSNGGGSVVSHVSSVRSSITVVRINSSGNNDINKMSRNNNMFNNVNVQNGSDRSVWGGDQQQQQQQQQQHTSSGGIKLRSLTIGSSNSSNSSGNESSCGSVSGSEGDADIVAPTRDAPISSANRESSFKGTKGDESRSNGGSHSSHGNQSSHYSDSSVDSISNVSD